MTVLVVGLPEGEELERLRSRIQSNPHFRVISHAAEPAVALAHARVLLPDVTVLAVPGALDTDPGALGVFRGVRALDPPSGVVLRTTATTAPADLARLAEDGAVHIVRDGDGDGLMHALRTIGLARDSCDPDDVP
ncbi:hypothetical protein ACFWBF_02240 [Streptomyces sp. NPDC060028]|uniref:hypothetical protein n=1 Tax=Streptomyces sp. NPDC060028 TaxID=3347041 RepID=UPI0036CD4E20